MTTATYNPYRAGTKTCKYCHESNLHWGRVRYPSGKHWWRLHNSDFSVHNCPQSFEKPQSQNFYAKLERKERETQQQQESSEQQESSDSTESTESTETSEEELPEEELETPKVERDFSRHLIVPEMEAWISERQHIFLVGPAGSGKTSAARMAAESLELDYYEKSMGPQTSEWNLTGFVNPTTGGYIPGCLRQPFEFGGVLLLDEMDAANPGVMVTLNAALANGHYTFPDGKEIEKHPDFVCIAAGNTYGGGESRVYVGRNQLDGATLDRFANVPMDYDTDAEIFWATGEAPSNPTTSEPTFDGWGTWTVEKWVLYVQRIRDLAVAHQMRVVISPRASIAGAKMLAAGKLDFATVADRLIFQKMTSDDRTRLQSLV